MYAKKIPGLQPGPITTSAGVTSTFRVAPIRAAIASLSSAVPEGLQ